MKTFMATLLLFGTCTAGAVCPVLVGKFVCETPRGSTEVEVKQQDVNGITEFTLSDASGEFTYIAGGTEYPYTIPERNETGSLRSVCENEALVSYIKGLIKNHEQKVVDSWDITQNFKLDSDKNLVISSTGSQLVNGEQKVLDEKPYLCKRK